MYYNVIDMKDPDRKIKVFNTSHYLFEKELIDEAESGEDGEFVDFASIEDGKIISFRASKVKRGGFEYMEYRSFNFIDREEELDEELIDEAISFDELLKLHSYDELRDIFYGLDEEEDEDEENEEDISERKKGKRRKAKKDIEKEDEEEDDEDEEDEEEKDSDEDEEEDDEIKDTKKKDKKNKKNKCPYGHIFGKDADEYDDCDTCELWEECSEASS